MHSAGFVSRDIRPPNVLHDKTPNDVKLVLNDFGLAIRTNSKKIRDADLIAVANMRSIPRRVLRGELTVSDVDVLSDTAVGTDIIFVKENEQPCDDWQ